jgi:hypothetical protein
LIVRLCVGFEVLAAVQLDRNSTSRAVEVDNIRSDRILPTELEAEELARPQEPPEYFLSFRGSLTKQGDDA